MKIFTILCVFLITCFSSYSQVGINTTDVNDSAILEIYSNNKGVLFPVLTLAQRVAMEDAANVAGQPLPAGLVIFCSACCTNGEGSLYAYNGTVWKPLDSSCTDINAPTVSPDCINVTATLTEDEHLQDPYSITRFFDGYTTYQTQNNNATDMGKMKMHEDSNNSNKNDIISFSLAQSLPVDYQVVIYWDEEQRSSEDLGLIVDLKNGGTESQSSINTKTNTLPNSTNVEESNENYKLTITIVAETDTIIVKSSDDGSKDPHFLEFKILDDSGNEIDYSSCD